MSGQATCSGARRQCTYPFREKNIKIDNVNSGRFPSTGSVIVVRHNVVIGNEGECLTSQIEIFPDHFDLDHGQKSHPKRSIVELLIIKKYGSAG